MIFLTPSHRGDLERCRLLEESGRRWLAGDWEHWIVVSGEDRAGFDRLASPRVRILDHREFLPALGGAASRALGGWHLQQLVKLAASAAAPGDRVVCVDSDIAWVAPANPALFEPEGDGRLLFFRAPPVEIAEFASWRHQARALLAVDPSRALDPAPNYVGPLLPWRPALVRATLERVEAVAARPWFDVLVGVQALSEYVLHGTFVDECLEGGAAAGLAPGCPPLCDSWFDARTPSEGELARFLAARPPATRALMISSRAGVDPRRYRSHVLGGPAAGEDGRLGSTRSSR